MNVNDFLYKSLGRQYFGIDDMQVNSIRSSEQIISDCYLLSSLDALTNTKNGRKILKSNITTSQYADSTGKVPCFSIKFSNLERVPVYADEYSSYDKLNGNQENPIIRNFEIAFSKLLKENKSLKPIISRLGSFRKTHNLEYYIPSKFMELFTGVKPISIGEKGLNINLKQYKKETLALFKRMEENPDFSFVAGTGVKKFDRTWHCYTITKVENGRIYLKNKRGNEIKSYTYDEAMDKLKYVVGYFDEDLKQTA